MANTTVQYGPRLIGHPTGSLRAALCIAPTPGIESIMPLQGEPNAVYRRALEQHGILVKTLEYFGVKVTLLEPGDAAPMAAAANDLAVVFEHGAAIMRPSALNRSAEIERLEDEFSHIDIPIAGHIVSPGLLDGSDVLLAGDVAFIGVSNRNNAIGRAGFAEIARANGFRPVEVKLGPDVRSLRCVVNAVNADTVVIATGRVDHAAFKDFKQILLPLGEEYGAGVFPLGENRVISDVRYRESLGALRKAGVAVESIDLYDFLKAGLVPANLVLALQRV